MYFLISCPCGVYIYGEVLVSTYRHIHKSSNRQPIDLYHRSLPPTLPHPLRIPYPRQIPLPHPLHRQRRNQRRPDPRAVLRRHDNNLILHPLWPIHHLP